MSEPRETELKLDVEASDLARLREHPLLAGTWTETELTSVYYDTPDGRLREAGYTLRVRRDGERHIQTVKARGPAAAGLFDRPEWESDVAGERPDPASFAGTPVAALLDGADDLAPLYTSTVTRSVRRLADTGPAGSRIEVALDRGRVWGPDDRVSPISEIEFELTGGSPQALFDLARTLAADVPLRLGVLSKFERGDALVAGRLGRAVKAEPVSLTPDMTAAKAFQAVAYACLRQMRLNETVLLARRDVEALHQLRVSLRRLRSAFSLFGAVIEDRRVPGIKAELKRLIEPFGHARNLDVYLGKTLPRERERRPDEPGLLILERHLETERAAAHDAVRAVLESRAWRDFLLDLVAWIESGPWLGPDNAGAARRDGPARAFATEELERRRRQVKKRGRHLADLDPEARHRVRIAAKKLRYGAEFFAALYDGRKAAKRHKVFVEALADLQDHLGDLNDIATAHTLAAELARGAPEGAVFAAGMATADTEARSRHLLAAADTAHEALIDVRPFWR
ncbi:CYTH and CHAD domain-containing protein [Methylobacterium platani]|uniref:Metal-chelation protein CHAD n=2 Tax=Methylobacterium platani TaxID=427683 RepID=A0A179RZV1_9HYPH|nr:CYTH and CHAD domain-containing protein [Methylobacterium platani]KMO17562.1 metal-chelation protein CHAD [Methylobacterium platani JCM 14648]OAS18179.1 metal-chelation protein CHAD [Methylobacterium platani]